MEHETNGDQGPRMLGSRSAHALMRSLIAAEPPGRALDAATGYGAMAHALRGFGFEVRCCDVDTGLFELDGVTIDEVDLNGPLPYADESFDVVTCANAIHRLYNVEGALAEFRRILKPGGKLFLSFNNYSNITKRIRFLLYGSLTNKTNEARFVQTIDAPAARLRQALFYPYVHNTLEEVGLRIDAVRGTPPRSGALLLAPLALLIRAFTTLAPIHKRTTNRIGQMNSWKLLPGGKYLAVAASKPSG
jgi:SAM-dependent methyltransferase